MKENYKPRLGKNYCLCTQQFFEGLFQQDDFVKNWPIGGQHRISNVRSIAEKLESFKDRVGVLLKKLPRPNCMQKCSKSHHHTENLRFVCFTWRSRAGQVIVDAYPVKSFALVVISKFVGKKPVWTRPRTDERKDERRRLKNRLSWPELHENSPCGFNLWESMRMCINNNDSVAPHLWGGGLRNIYNCLAWHIHFIVSIA